MTIEELAEALYEGRATLRNLAESMARIHGQASALPFWRLMGPETRYFWRSIAFQIIAHSEHWLPNNGSACVLDDEETERLERLISGAPPDDPSVSLPIRLSYTEADLRKLVAGDVVERTWVPTGQRLEVALEDIGLDRIREILERR